MYMMRMFTGVMIVVALLAMETVVQAGIIASTDFDGRTVSGATASNLTWVTNGVADPGNLTATDDLFDTVDTADKFAVNKNLKFGGTWSVDVPLNVGGLSIDLDTVTLDAYAFNGQGNFHPQQRDMDITVSLLDASFVLIDSDLVVDIWPSSTDPPVLPQAISFDLSGNTLAANTDYFVRIFVSKTDPAPTGFNGNNGGFDNLVVNGVVVPEPSSFALAVVGLLSLVGFARRRK